MTAPLASRVLLVLALLGTPLLGAGCGGGGAASGGSSTLTFSPSTNVTLQASGTATGTVSTLAGLQVGQFLTIRMVTGLRFGLFPFLGSANTIDSARLRLRQVSTSGEPYLVHGSVVADHVDFGLSLGAGDASPPVVTSDLGVLSSDATLGIKELDVTAAVAAAVAANSLTIDFLLRFNDLTLSPVVDYASFEDAAGGLGTPDGPQLIVTYR